MADRLLRNLGGHKGGPTLRVHEPVIPSHAPRWASNARSVRTIASSPAIASRNVVLGYRVSLPAPTTRGCGGVPVLRRVRGYPKSGDSTPAGRRLIYGMPQTHASDKRSGNRCSPPSDAAGRT
jgi:hypothetical protein